MAGGQIASVASIKLDLMVYVLRFRSWKQHFQSKAYLPHNTQITKTFATDRKLNSFYLILSEVDLDL